MRQATVDRFDQSFPESFGVRKNTAHVKSLDFFNPNQIEEAEDKP